MSKSKYFWLYCAFVWAVTIEPTRCANVRVLNVFLLDTPNSTFSMASTDCISHVVEKNATFASVATSAFNSGVFVNNSMLTMYDVIIFPSMEAPISIGSEDKTRLLEWVAAGGTLFLLGDCQGNFATVYSTLFSLKSITFQTCLQNGLATLRTDASAGSKWEGVPDSVHVVNSSTVATITKGTQTFQEGEASSVYASTNATGFELSWVTEFDVNNGIVFIFGNPYTVCNSDVGWNSVLSAILEHLYRQKYGGGTSKDVVMEIYLFVVPVYAALLLVHFYFLCRSTSTGIKFHVLRRILIIIQCVGRIVSFLLLSKYLESFQISQRSEIWKVFIIFAIPHLAMWANYGLGLHYWIFLNPHIAINRCEGVWWILPVLVGIPVTVMAVLSYLYLDLLYSYNTNDGYNGSINTKMLLALIPSVATHRFIVIRKILKVLSALILVQNMFWVVGSVLYVQREDLSSSEHIITASSIWILAAVGIDVLGALIQIDIAAGSKCVECFVLLGDTSTVQLELSRMEIHSRINNNNNTTTNNNNNNSDNEIDKNQNIVLPEYQVRSTITIHKIICEETHIDVFESVKTATNSQLLPTVKC
eukprot:jgi/Bigna1/130663/aug1.12_g5371